MKLIDMPGMTFNRLYVVERVEDYVTPKGRREAQFLCRCECNKEVVVKAKNIVSGHTKSCGCIRPKKIKPMIEKQYVKGCIYNMQGVFCDDMSNCHKCGWNPANKKLFKERMGEYGCFQSNAEDEDSSLLPGTWVYNNPRCL